MPTPPTNPQKPNKTPGGPGSLPGVSAGPSSGAGAGAGAGTGTGTGAGGAKKPVLFSVVEDTSLTTGGASRQPGQGSGGNIAGSTPPPATAKRPQPGIRFASLDTPSDAAEEDEVLVLQPSNASRRPPEDDDDDDVLVLPPVDAKTAAHNAEDDEDDVPTLSPAQETDDEVLVLKPATPPGTAGGGPAKKPVFASVAAATQVERPTPSQASVHRPGISNKTPLPPTVAPAGSRTPAGWGSTAGLNSPVGSGATSPAKRSVAPANLETIAPVELSAAAAPSGPATGVPQISTTSLRYDARRRKKGWGILIGSIGMAVLLVVAGAWWMEQQPGGKSARNRGEAPDVDNQVARDEQGRELAPGELAPPTYSTVKYKVITHEPGFYVLVDGEPARDQAGKLLETPCEFRITKGEHILTVVKKGFKDSTLAVNITQSDEFGFKPQYEPFDEPKGFLASRFGLADVGQEIPLNSLNLDGKVYDPCLAPDGLTMWFAGDRKEGKGIYYSTRKTLYDEWGEPQFITSTRSSELPSSPTVCEVRDGFILAYLLRGSNRVWSMKSEGLSGVYDNRQLLRSTEREDEEWLSLQLAQDGKDLYCAYKRVDLQTGSETDPAETVKTYLVQRQNLDQKLDKKWQDVRLPGAHPCLSADGLRQYAFDGQRLTRATRKKISQPFSTPRVIAELTLKSYVHRPAYRQYWVSEDEQWLYYTDDPERGGNLFAVRLAALSDWKFVARGKMLVDKETLIAAQKNATPTGTLTNLPGEDEPKGTTETKPEKPMTEEPAKAPDPRSLPLPYAEFRPKYEALLAEWKFAEAEKLVQAAQADPKHAADAQVLKWDAEELALMRACWKDLEEALGKYKAGDSIRIGTILEFEKYADGKIHAKTKVKDFVKPLVEVTVSDIIAILDKHLDKTSEEAQLKIAAFLMAAPGKSSPQAIQLRLDRSGLPGRTIPERQPKRKLHLMEQEFARKNFGAGLQILDQIVALAPKSETATRGLALKEELYALLKWTPIGNQKWDMSKPGEFTVTGKRTTDAHLGSELEYENFQLQLEWKTVGTGAQGGVWFHYAGKGELRANAFKIQLANDYPIRARADLYSTGALMGIRGPDANVVKKEGEWNTLVMRVENGRVKVNVNGLDILNTPFSDPKIPPQGRICLDGEFPGITYRKIMIYDLPGKAVKPVKPVMVQE